MRICSLLPSITEVLFELGLGDSVVAVTHECDWPIEAQSKTPVTRSRIRTEGRSSGDIDAQVGQAGGSLYDLDDESLARLRPDVIFTQSLCPVCAVDEGLVRRVAEQLPGRPEVFSFHPTSLADVQAMIAEIGRVTHRTAAAEQLGERFRREIDRVRQATAARQRTDTVCLEWTDPPFACGHWTPELVEIAGGRELLGRTGEPSRRVSWSDVLAADPDVLVVAPCGFPLARALEEGAWLRRQPGWTELCAVRYDRVFAADGSAYFNRPGPRLIDSLHILAEILHADLFAGIAPAGAFQQIARVAPYQLIESANRGGRT